MKHFFIIGLIAIALFQLAGPIPVSEAPTASEAQMIAQTLKSIPVIPADEPQLDDKTRTLVELLEQYVDEDRDFPRAEVLIRQTERTEVNEKILELFQARILSRSLQFEQAEQLLNQLNDDQLALLKAAVLIAKGDRDRAGNYLHELVETNPSRDVKLTALSLLNVYHTFDKHREADQSYLWTLFAQKLGELKEWEIALYLANKAHLSRPDYRDALLIKGYCEMQLKRFEEAEESLLEAYRLDPGNTQIQYMLGLTYFELDQPSLSSRYFLYARENEALYQTLILDKLGENAVKLEDYPLAAYYLEQALEAGADDFDIYRRIIWLEGEQLEQLEKAYHVAEQLVLKYPDNPQSYHLMSWVLNKQEKVDLAVRYLEKADALQ